MTNLLGQLKRWRLVERLIRLAWGTGRWVAIVGAVLAVACLTDWLADRYLGSESWRKFRTATWVFAPRAATEENWSPDAVMDETPKWLRVLMTGGQLLLAGGLAYLFLLRPWVRTPPVDDLASTAEKAIPEFGHRLVTAVQLNRPTARTQGMSKVLIAEVTREAGEMARRHNLLKLVNYSRLLLALAVALPVLGAWGAFALAKPDLTRVLLQRQLLLNVEIPRTIHLKNVSQEVWPTGAEVEVRYLVTGEYEPDLVGRLRVEPEIRYRLTGQALDSLRSASVPEAVVEKVKPLRDKELSRKEFQKALAEALKREEDAPFQSAVWDRLETVRPPEEYYDLKYTGDAEGGAIFATKLPAATSDFSFSARLGNGRSREPGFIRFEAPPHVREIESWQLLPRFLGTTDGKPNGPQFERQTDGAKRGEVVDALPLSDVRIVADFTKPIRRATLIPIERGEGIRERELPVLAPGAVSDDRQTAVWRFPTTPRMIGYRIELVDDRGFINAVPIRRNIRMLDDRPPVVTFMPESDRHPDPNDFFGKGDPRVYEWGDKMPLAEDGRIMVIYRATSEQGVGRVNIRYRVYPRGIALDAYPEKVQQIQHPRQDPENEVYSKLTLKPVTADLKTVGAFVPDLGLFEKSWQGLDDIARDRVNIEFYALPSPTPATQPAQLEAGGRYNFEIAGLEKKLPDGSTAKLEVGDTVELFVEVFDKNPLPGRAPGYTKEARRKIVVTTKEAREAIEMRDQQNRRLLDKLAEIRKDQENVFKEKKENEKDPPKK
jgi:hypothetical protein